MSANSNKNIQYIEHVSDTSKPYVILFHGFGADMNDLESLKDVLNPDGQQLNWIFPNGVFSVPVGPGFTGRAWWPLQLSKLPDDWTNYSPPEMPDLTTKIFKFIDSLNVPWNQIILGGFSQGAMFATEIYFQATEKPLGLMSLSGSLIRKDVWLEKCLARKNEKIFLSHGEQDQVLPSGGTQKLIQILKKTRIKYRFCFVSGRSRNTNASLSSRKKIYHRKNCRPQMSFVIEAKNLSRSYKTYSKKEGILESVKGFWNRQYTEKSALKNVNINLEGGKIIGLVGSNGAGKTTLLKILAGLIHPTSGTVQVLGYNPFERKNEYLKQISLLLGQKNQLWWDISARDSYALLAKIYDLDSQVAKKTVDDLAHILGCTNVLDTQLRRLSLGERMKMEIIGSLLHQPKVLFLDEPTIGLDIVAQNAIRNFLETYVKEYKPLVILTSHYMDDITQLADQLLLISKGELVYNGSVDHFMLGSNLTKKIIYRYKNDTIEHIATYQASDLSEKLNEILKHGEVSDLKTEEVDFEEVIHGFLAKESGI